MFNPLENTFRHRPFFADCLRSLSQQSWLKWTLTLTLLALLMLTGIWKLGRNRSTNPLSPNSKNTLSEKLSTAFPGIREQLAVRAEFAPSSHEVKGIEVKGFIPKPTNISAAGTKPNFRNRVAEHAGLRRVGLPQRAGLSSANNLAAFKPFFPADYTDPFVVEGGGLKIVLRPIGAARAKAEVVDGKVGYLGIYQDTDSLHTAAGQRSEEFLVLHTSDAPTRFEYEISEATGVERVEKSDGGLRFISADGRGVQIEAPWVIDAKGKKDSKAISWELGAKATDGTQRLSLVLEAENLTYPLVIDPTWVYFGPPLFSREGQTATLLPNGEVLLAGGISFGESDELRNSEVYNPRSGRSFITKMNNDLRFDHTATLLPNGQVLVAGGEPNGKSVELYNPSTQTWSVAGDLVLARRSHKAILLVDGRVLLIGGAVSGAVEAELYNPAGGTWQLTEKPVISRAYGHTATRLIDGRVLVTGGFEKASSSGFIPPTNSAEIYDPKSGKWVPASSLREKRAFHTATLLPDGKVLVVGGHETELAEGVETKKTSEIYDPTANVWTAVTGMSVARAGHTATLLQNNKVLIAGGLSAIDKAYPQKVEIYDPAAETWGTAGDLSEGRLPEATRLPDGNVLITGGGASSAEIYDPATGKWGTVKSLNNWRDLATATLLPNNKVLFAGGYDSIKKEYGKSAEMYDPATGVWSLIGSLNVGRYFHTSTLLPDGKVLAVGGFDGSRRLNSAEIYDPVAGTWSLTANLSVAHSGHTATLLPNGKVLIVGGFDGASQLKVAEIYDPMTKTWNVTGSLSAARTLHTATLLPNGKVLVVGGNDANVRHRSAEIYDPATGAWNLTGSLSLPRNYHNAVQLLSGDILVVSGQSPALLNTAEIYNPVTGTWRTAASLKAAHGLFSTATLLPSGRVLVAGGRKNVSNDVSDFLKSVEIYDPATDSWAESSSLNVARAGHTAILLSDSSVLVAGGFGGSTNITAGVSAEIYLTPPDLQVTDLQPPPEVLTETPFDLRWTIKNAGDKTAKGPWTDKIYISADANFSANDTLVGAFPFDGSINPGQIAERIQTITLPRLSIPQDGNYYFIVVADADNQVDETPFEGNNTKAIPVTIKRKPIPDLIVDRVNEGQPTAPPIEAPGTAFFGQKIVVKWRVKNMGNGATNAPEWFDWVYLSSDDVPEIEDPVRIPVRNVSYLAPGESYVSSAEIMIPRGLVGNYNIIVYTDFDGTNHRGSAGKGLGNDRVDEIDENNNWDKKTVIRIDVPPLPDLQVTSVPPPPSGQACAGQTMPVSWKVENKGTGNLPPDQSQWEDGIYLSKQQSFDPTKAKLIGSRTTNKDELNRLISYSVTIPRDIVVAENWYVFVMADYKNAIFEFDKENNNVGGSSSTVRICVTPPDLTIKSLAVPSAATAGRQVTINWTVQNQGAFPAQGGWTDTVYLSAKQTFDPASATVLATVPRGGDLDAGKSYDASATVTIPACSSGDQFIFVVTDSRNEQFEFDPNFDAEQNNSAFKPIAIALAPPDLQVTAASNPPVGNAGQPITISWTVTNRGAGPTIEASWTDRVYLSASPAFDATKAIAIGSFGHEGALAKDATYPRTESIKLPNTVQGNYYVFVQTDVAGNVAECSGEGNNVTKSDTLLNVDNKLPDLTVINPNAPPNALAGQTITVKWDDKNAGNAELKTAAWNDAVYLSSKATLDGSAKQLQVKLVSSDPVAINGTRSVQAEVKIPVIPAGDYFLIVKADESNVIFEGIHEDNNTATAAIRINNPNVDLTVTSITIPASAFSGQEMEVRWTVANNGGQTTLGVDWSDYVYLSRDQILDPTDQQLGWTQHSGALNGGASYNVTLKVNIPAGLSGLYYVFVRTDQHNQIGETNEDNNAVKATNALDVQLPPPADLVIVENSIIVPPSGSPGEEATISWMVKNAGQNVASGRWTEAVYLSRDAQWDISDALIGRVEYDGYAKPLAVGASATETLKQPLPAIEPGSYYVIVRADVRNNVREDSVGETNNTTPSTAKIAVDVPELTLGVPRSDTLKTGQERYYKVNVPGNETLRLTLDGQSPNAFNELFARFGLMPSHSYYDFLFNRPYESDQEIVIPNSIAGTYYILGGNVYSQLQNNSIEVKAEVASSGIRSINPIVGGNVGTVTIEINGSNFTPLLEATLLGAISIRANEVSVISKAKAYAVFDLRGAMPGSYNMEVNQPILSYDARDGKITEKRDNSILQEAFSIVPALPTTPDVRLSLPESIRPSREFPVTVVYSNYGKNDVVSPWVRISIDGGKFVVPDGGTSMAKQERSVDLLILNNDGIPGILRPGYTGTIIINAISSAGAKGVKLHIRSISAGENIVDYTRLYELVGKAWGKDTWDAFVRSTGATWNSLLDRLVREARVAFSTDLIVDPYKMIERILNSINIVSQANNINAESLRQASLRWSINGWQSNNFIGETGLQYNPYGQVNCPALEKAIKESWVPTYTRQRFGSIHNDFFDLWLNKKMENYFDATSKFGVAEAVLKSATFNTVLEELEGYLKRYFEIMNESQCNDRVAKIFVNLAEGIPGKLPPLATAKGEYGWVVPGSPRLLEVQGQVARVIRFNDISESDLYLTFASCSFFISKIIEVNVLKNGDDLKLVAEVTPKLVDLYNFNPHGAPTIIDEPQPSIIELPIAAIDEEERRFYKARFAQSVYVLQKSCGFNSPDVIVRLGTFQTTAMVRRVHDCECKAVGDFPLMNRPECKRCIESDCRDDYDYDVDIRPPVDPNEKSATGYNRLNFVPAINDLGYQISFENLPTAQGYANRVVISDQLSNNLDWRIFRLKEIGFGKYRIQIPPNRAFYQGRIQLGEDLGNLLADISAGINITTGQVTWTLTAIDPKTGEQPNSVLLGLLPPNDSSGRGQGYVTYTVQPKAGVPTGTVISNKATIIFDTEEPITTNTVTNTLDADAPSSRVTPLPSLSQPTFTLTWSGEDPAGGSGLQSFDIWVSEGGGPYQPFLSGTTDTSTQFTGQPGKTYHFYSVARDNAGNVEAAPPIYDTGTTVLILSPTLTSLSPNSAQACGAAFTLTVNGTNFVSNSTVNWNGAARPTTFVSATQLTAAIPASDLASAGTANITIFNPEPGGGTSAALPFTILPSNPVPAISAINPNSATAGGAAFTMTVTGTKFINGSKVLWSGKELATTFVSGSQLTAQVTAAEIATASTAQVTVFNPPPCGGTSGGLVFTINPRPPDYEADVSPRPNSDRSVTIADWVQVGRFVTGVETPEEGGEYQRADCAPRATLGDGKLTIADWVQAGRYASGLDPLTPAGGPTKPSGAFVTESTDVAAGTVMRSLRIENATFQRGQVGTLAIEMDAQGSENAVSFTLNYDAALLSFVEAVPLTDATLMVNTSRATNGRIGISLALPVGKTMSTGISRILTLRFIPVGGANDAITKIAFGDQVVKGEVVDTLANTLPGTAFAEGTVLVAGHAVANVSAADYSGPVLAVESIVAAFGTELAIATDEARGLPLPNVLAGTTVRVKDSQGDERIAPLFFVSPAQVNYQIPAGTAEGIATVTIINADGLISLGLIQVAASKPGLFSADAGGSGLAAGYVVRTKLDGLQSFEPISRFDVVSNQFALLPIDLGSESEQVTLAMFGVGIRNRKSLAEVKVFIGDLECLAEYAGAQGTFVGLDQINVRLPRVLAGQGEVNVRVSVEGYLANTVKIHVR